MNVQFYLLTKFSLCSQAETYRLQIFLLHRPHSFSVSALQVLWLLLSAWSNFSLLAYFGHLRLITTIAGVA